MGNEATLKLKFETNITARSSENIDALTNSLERLDKLDLSNISQIAASLSSLNNVKISPSLGTAVVNLVNAMNKISEIENVGNITQVTADSMEDGFRKISQATSSFIDNTARIPSGTATIVTAIKDLNGVALELDDSIGPAMMRGFRAIANAVTVFKSADMKDVSIPKGLGNEISGLVSAVKMLDDLPDLTAMGNNLEIGFQKIRKAIEAFSGLGELKISIPSGLGDKIPELISALRSIKDIPDISGEAANLNNGLNALATALKNFSGFAGSKTAIPAGLDKKIPALVSALQAIKDIPDISSEAANLNSGFLILAQAIKNFDGVTAKIPVSLGRGVTGLVNAINEISGVKDISSVAGRLNSNFATIAKAVTHFNSLNNVNYAGVAKLVTALTNIGKIKAINNNVIRNAEKLAKAINILDRNIAADTPRLQAMASVVRQLGPAFNSASTGTANFGNSLRLVNMASFVILARQAVHVIKELVGAARTAVKSYGELQNSVAFFGQSMGGATQEVGNQIAEWANLGLVDFSQFSNNVAVVNQMLKGYGIASKDASKMALNLTQMAYDASYSLGKNGEDLEMWLGRTQSLMAGQARVGYEFGIDATVKALSENFDGLSNNTDKASRAIATYETLLANTTAIQGQFAREINTTYVQQAILENQMGTLIKSIGRALAPAFLQLIKIAMVALKVVTMVIDAVLKLFGGEGFKLIDYKEIVSGISSSVDDVATSTDNVATGSDDVAKGMKNANKAAKELKKTITAIDQVFTINDKVDDAASGINGLKDGLGGLGGIGAGVSGYDFIGDAAMAGVMEMMDEIDAQAEEVFNTLKKWAPVILGIGAAFATWKIGKKLLEVMNWLSGLKSIKSGISFDIEWGGLGAIMLMADLDEFMKYFDDFLKNGPTFKNVVGMLSEFSGMLGDVFVIFGNLKIGGVLKLVQGIGEIVIAVKDISENGFNWSNVKTLLRGLTNLAIGIGLFTKNLKLAAWAVAIQGIIGIIDDLKAVVEAIKTGDWSSVDWGSLVVHAVEVIGGIFIALGGLKKLSSKFGGTKATETITTASTTVEQVSTSTSNLTKTLKSLIKNLALGLVIILEVVAAALLIVGAIILLGMGLEQVGIAWEPVIANGENVAIGMGLGIAMLVAIGVVVALLGTAGSPLIVALGLGIAILAELGIAAGLFILEIIAIGIGLEQIGIAWGPVLANGEEISDAIALGTALLVGIGVVTAALGAATVASVGLLPLAIALGTALLVELAVAFVAFVESLVAVANSLNNDLYPALAPLVANLPTLTSNMSAFVDGMVNFAGEFVRYSLASTVAGLSATIDMIIGWFTKDPIQKMIDDVEKQAERFASLNLIFDTVLPELEKGATGMQKYAELLEKLKEMADKASTVEDMPAMSTNLSDFAYSLKDAFEVLKSIETEGVTNIVYALEQLDLSRFKGIGANMAVELAAGLNEYSFDLTTLGNNVATGLDTGLAGKGTEAGNEVSSELMTAANEYSFTLTSFGNNIRTSMSNSLLGKGTEVGKNVSREVMDAINGYVFTFVIAIFNITRGLTFDSTPIGTNIAAGVVNGINGYSVNLSGFESSIKTNLQAAFDIHSPSRWGRSFIGHNIGDSVVMGINETNVDTSEFEGKTKNALDRITNIGAFKPIDVPVDAKIDTSRINGDVISATSKIGASVKGEYEYTDDTTTEAIYEQTEETTLLLMELIQAVKESSIMIDYKGVSKRITEEQAKDKNIRNVRTYR